MKNEILLGQHLHVEYAPEFESVEETQNKLLDRIETVKDKIIPGVKKEEIEVRKEEESVL